MGDLFVGLPVEYLFYGVALLLLTLLPALYAPSKRLLVQPLSLIIVCTTYTLVSVFVFVVVV